MTGHPFLYTVLLLVALTMAACSGSESIADPPEPQRARTFDASPDGLREAVEAHFEAGGFDASGDLAWERAAVSAVVTLFGPAREHVAAAIQPSGTGARVVLLIRYRGESGSEVRINPSLAAVEYTRHLDGIAAHLARG